MLVANNCILSVLILWKFLFIFLTKLYFQYLKSLRDGFLVIHPDWMLILFDYFSKTSTVRCSFVTNWKLAVFKTLHCWVLPESVTLRNRYIILHLFLFILCSLRFVMDINMSYMDETCDAYMAWWHPIFFPNVLAVTDVHFLLSNQIFRSCRCFWLSNAMRWGWSNPYVKQESCLRIVFFFWANQMWLFPLSFKHLNFLWKIEWSRF